MRTGIVLLSSAAILTLALAVRGQYTPGPGGSFVAPSTPYVPAPTGPVGPTAPSTPSGQPSYSWETPPNPQPAQPIYQPQTTSVLAPVQPDTVRITQPQVANIPQLTDSQMADLTASIALYPDPLLAEVLPAATSVEELTYVDKWLEQHPGADDRAIAGVPVEDSVRSVAHYPAVLKLMTDHLDWTQALGIAFTYQRQDLFDSIQHWRATAVSNGYLFSSPQQDVLQQGTVILIQPPAQTQVVYVPVYDPAVVYVRPVVGRRSQNVITFATGGFSLSFVDNNLDWRDHEIRVPRHDDPRVDAPRGGAGIVPPAGRGDTPPDTRTVFVPNTIRPGFVYPQKVLTPQPDKKVITLPPPSVTPSVIPGRGPGGLGGPGRGAGGSGRGPGGMDNNPNTPF